LKTRSPCWRRAAGAPEIANAGRCWPRVRPPRSERDHFVRRRGAAHEAGARTQQRQRDAHFICWMSLPRACISTTCASCSKSSTARRSGQLGHHHRTQPGRNPQRRLDFRPRPRRRRGWRPHRRPGPPRQDCRHSRFYTGQFLNAITIQAVAVLSLLVLTMSLQRSTPPPCDASGLVLRPGIQPSLPTSPIQSYEINQPQEHNHKEDRFQKIHSSQKEDGAAMSDFEHTPYEPEQDSISVPGQVLLPTAQTTDDFAGIISIVSQNSIAPPKRIRISAILPADSVRRHRVRLPTVFMLDCLALHLFGAANLTRGRHECSLHLGFEAILISSHFPWALLFSVFWNQSFFAASNARRDRFHLGGGCLPSPWAASRSRAGSGTAARPANAPSKRYLSFSRRRVLMFGLGCLCAFF